MQSRGPSILKQPFGQNVMAIHVLRAFTLPECKFTRAKDGAQLLQYDVALKALCKTHKSMRDR